MNRTLVNRLGLLATLFVAAACASPRPSSNLAASGEAIEPAGDALLAAGEALAISEGVTGDDALADAGIEAVEPPQPQEVPSAMLPDVHQDEPVIVCTREVPTGSRLAVEVCRNLSDVEQRQQEDQRLFDRIKTNTAIGASRL